MRSFSTNSSVSKQGCTRPRSSPFGRPSTWYNEGSTPLRGEGSIARFWQEGFFDWLCLSCSVQMNRFPYKYRRFINIVHLTISTFHQWPILCLHPFRKFNEFQFANMTLSHSIYLFISDRILIVINSQESCLISDATMLLLHFVWLVRPY